ncbi:chaperonin [Vibrio parahaemolyticus]|nr:chaperonin [Vibrio parahaemolyticus]
MATTERQVRQKKLNNVPASYFDIHKELKASGFTTLNFEAYIMEAIREKFQRDNAI